ncbi:MAG: hypothetical protein ACKOKF_04780 [Bacteroidota bacterium]
MENNQQGQKSNKLWLVLFLLSAGLNIYLWMNKETEVNTLEVRVDEMQVDSVNFENEIAAAKAEINSYQGKNAELDSLLKEANAKIDEQAKKMKGVSGQRDKLKKQLAELQALVQDYLNRIDSLIVANDSLKGANTELVSEKQKLTYNVATLSKDLESTVQTASALKAEYIKISTFKRRDNGKYVVTPLAKRTHKMEVCFDIMDNKIAKSGNRNVYVCITEPGGKTIGNRSTGSGEFTTKSGDSRLYTAVSSIDYTGTKRNVCISHEEKDDKKFAPGTYLVEVYVDKELAGAGSAILK